MSRQKTAYITGGASGIGRSLATHLLSQGWQVYISDIDVTSAKAFAEEFNSSSSSPNPTLHYTQCDTKSWSSQVTAFQAALGEFDKRIDFIAPIAGIGERSFLPPYIEGQLCDKDAEFVEPNLSVIDIDLTGVLYTLALAIQQFRRQEPLSWNEGTGPCRGKIGIVASVCGFYCVPTLPIYTAAKHALIGLTRSYGALLIDESITVNAVAPNVVRTNISPDWFYDEMEKKGLMTRMEGVMEAFEEMIEGEGSGEVFECGPKGGWMKREGVEYLDEMSGRVCGELEGRSRGLHYA